MLIGDKVTITIKASEHHAAIFVTLGNISLQTKLELPEPSQQCPDAATL
jgi:hypothetical protein